jgi:hypothetical protein
MRAFLIFGWVFVVTACVAPQRRPFIGWLPDKTVLDMAGAFTFSPEGELQLALAEECHAVKTGSSNEWGPCDRAHLDTIRVIAHTPWNQDIRGTWSDAAHIAFRIDLKTTGLDPLTNDAPTLVARPWSISGTQWSPTSGEAEAILKLVGVATETETDVIHGGPAPSLEVTTFEIDGGTLHTGDPSTLAVRIANHGPGTAYRVVATTRSSLEALRGRRLSFGLIKPGTDKVRQLKLNVSASETAPDPMLVLELSEANGFAPANVSRRIRIAPSVSAPVLGMRCAIVGHNAPRPDLDAGQKLTLRCAVDNTGKVAATSVELEASVAGAAPTHSASQAIAVAGQAIFDMPITVPRDLPIDAPVEIVIVARDRQSSRSASTTVVGVVRKPKLCVKGQLTDAQYRAKLTELRAAVTAGDLTQAQLDRYDAEMVTCLK